MEIALTVVSLIFVLVGVIFIFDARKITKNRFSIQDINEGTKYLKIFGFVISLYFIGDSFVNYDINNYLVNFFVHFIIGFIDAATMIIPGIRKLLNN